MHGAAKFIACARGNGKLLAKAISKIGAVRSASRRAVVTGTDYRVVFNDDRAETPSLSATVCAMSR